MAYVSSTESLLESRNVELGVRASGWTLKVKAKEGRLTFEKTREKKVGRANQFKSVLPRYPFLLQRVRSGQGRVTEEMEDRENQKREVQYGRPDRLEKDGERHAFSFAPYTNELWTLAPGGVAMWSLSGISFFFHIDQPCPRRTP